MRDMSEAAPWKSGKDAQSRPYLKVSLCAQRLHRIQRNRHTEVLNTCNTDVPVLHQVNNVIETQCHARRPQVETNGYLNGCKQLNLVVV